jgi:hypothetical protein
MPVFMWSSTSAYLLSGAHGAVCDAEGNDVPATCPGAQTLGAQCPTHAL